MEPQFTYKLVNGTPVYDRPDIRHCYLENVGWRRGYETHHETKGPSKTPPQLAFYYGVVVEMAMAAMKKLGNKGGIVIEIEGKRKQMPVIKQVVDWIIKDAYSKEEGVDLVSKARMTKMECMALIDFATRWCAFYLHIVIPEPDVNWKEK